MKHLFIVFLLMGCNSIPHAVSDDPPPPYKRKQWKHWIDKDGDCQNERAEILIDESLAPVTFRDERTCVVASGKWFDSFTAKFYTKASELSIDHLVPLKHAHDHGGAHWSREKKKKFANDRENLLAVEMKENSKKSADGPHLYMPPNHDFHCDYIKKWLRVKRKYRLTASHEERYFVTRMAKKCDLYYAYNIGWGHDYFHDHDHWHYLHSPSRFRTGRNRCGY